MICLQLASCPHTTCHPGIHCRDPNRPQERWPAISAAITTNSPQPPLQAQHWNQGDQPRDDTLVRNATRSAPLKPCHPGKAVATSGETHVHSAPRLYPGPSTPRRQRTAKRPHLAPTPATAPPEVASPALKRPRQRRTRGCPSPSLNKASLDLSPPAGRGKAPSQPSRPDAHHLAYWVPDRPAELTARTPPTACPPSVRDDTWAVKQRARPTLPLSSRKRRGHRW